MADLHEPLARRALDWAMELVLPPVCPLCLVRLAGDEQVICDVCRSALAPEEAWRCMRCGAAGKGDAPGPGEPCLQCPPPESPYRGVVSAVRYSGGAARCVHRYKYHRRGEMGRLIAGIMAARLARPLAALEGRTAWIVPVPLHWSRHFWRGFNQSDELANALSRVTGWPVVNALARVRRTRMQSHLPREARAANVAGAFRIARNLALPPSGLLPGILLVDDVVTSGHTIEECARVLKGHGSPEVWVASFARA